MKKTLIIGAAVFAIWVLMWAVVRPLIDHFVHGQDMNIGQDLMSGAISGIIFTALFLIVTRLMSARAKANNN